SKDETPEVLIDFLRLVHRGLQAQVRVVRTNKGMEFLNQTLHAYFAAEGIQHKTDGENLDKMKEKGDECIFVGYSTQSRAYRVFNKRTRVIMESIHVNFDELPQMASTQNSSDPAPTCQTMASAQNNSDPAPTCQTMALAHNSSDPAPTCQTMASAQNSSDPTPTCQTMASAHNKPHAKNDQVADDEFINIFSTPVQDQRETSSRHTMALEHNSFSPGRNCQENVSHGDKTEPHAENDQVADDEFINIFSNSVYDQGETLSRHVDSSNMHTFYQRYPSEQR
nr:integrase, catalytic region, zinc finger, CCHC-type, peptidase aspartic, catalytic [Tanacetum cinerariifolium]